MGESACLMRSYSHPTDTSRESKEGNPLRALGESISFGRFMSESLAWEKWSSFSHNRYLEEAEKFSKPGSVAQMKAYFEAHYKRVAAKKAAALLEQDNAAADDVSELNITNVAQTASSIVGSESTKSNARVAIDSPQGVAAPNSELLSPDYVNRYNSNVVRYELENAKVETAESTTREDSFVEITSQVEEENQLGSIEKKPSTVAIQIEKTPIKEAADQEISVLKTEKRLAVASSMSITSTRKPKLPSSANVTTPRKEVHATSSSKKFARDSVDKNRSISRSLHMSINLSSRAGDASRKSSSIAQKIGNSKLLMGSVRISSKDSTTPLQTPTPASVSGKPKHPSVSPKLETRSSRAGDASRKTPSIAQKIGNSKLLMGSVRISKDGTTPLRTPTPASMSGKPKHPSVSPKLETRRTRTLLDRSYSGSRTADGNRHSLILDASGSKARSPTTSSPFSFKSEERAAKRKEFYQRLEEKKNAKEAEKVMQPNHKVQSRSSLVIQDKAENSLKQLQQSFSLLKVSQTHLQSPKLGRKPTTSLAQETSARPPRRPSIQINESGHNIVKNNRNLTRSVMSLRRNTHENASPNIPS